MKKILFTIPLFFVSCIDNTIKTLPCYTVEITHMDNTIDTIYTCSECEPHITILDNGTSAIRTCGYSVHSVNVKSFKFIN